MASQYAIQDPNRVPAVLGHSGTTEAAETRRWVVLDDGSGLVTVQGGTVSLGGTAPITIGGSVVVSSGTISVDNGTVTTQPDNTAKLTFRVDSAASGTTYVGMAQPGSNEGSSVWQVLRIVSAGGTSDTGLYAGGSATFTNPWSGRGTLSYS